MSYYCMYLIYSAAIIIQRVHAQSISAPSLRDFYYSRPLSEREQQDRQHQLEAMTTFLFPNRSAISNLLHPHGRGLVADGRGLAVTTPPSSSTPVVCVTCSGMVACPALNQFQIEEVYLPKNLEAKGTCVVLDELGTRVKDEVFGNGRSFRDTPQCRDIVMQYLCLFYGSNNNMYRNWCQFREDVSSANRAEHRVAPRYPCRSFCVQVATVCANDPLFLQLCEQIACPPKEDDCSPNPTIKDKQGKNQDLAANLGCDMPFKLDPYAPKNSAHGRYSGGGMVSMTSMFAMVLLAWAFALN